MGAKVKAALRISAEHARPGCLKPSANCDGSTSAKLSGPDRTSWVIDVATCVLQTY